MIQLLKSLLGTTGREPATRKPAVTARPRPTPAGGDYRAVSLAPNTACCTVASGSAGKRFLMREAPHVPLANCANPANCGCKFRKHADRRDGDRRLLGETEATRWFAGDEHRAGRRRRRAPSN